MRQKREKPRDSARPAGFLLVLWQQLSCRLQEAKVRTTQRALHANGGAAVCHAFLHCPRHTTMAASMLRWFIAAVPSMSGSHSECW